MSSIWPSRLQPVRSEAETGPVVPPNLRRRRRPPWRLCGGNSGYVVPVDGRAAHVAHFTAAVHNSRTSPPGPRAGHGEPPYPQGNQATHPGPSAAFVAVHKNAGLVSQSSGQQKFPPVHRNRRRPLLINSSAASRGDSAVTALGQTMIAERVFVSIIAKPMRQRSPLNPSTEHISAC